MDKEHKSSSKVDLEEYLHKHIPISSAMGIGVELATPERIVLGAPFSNNINHKQTVFGGSLHAVATLACWSLLHVNLAELDGGQTQIVIANSNVDYLIPVAADFKAECAMPEKADWERFCKILQRKGKARIKLSAKIIQDEKLCVDYSGIFVVLRVQN